MLSHSVLETRKADEGKPPFINELSGSSTMQFTAPLYPGGLLLLNAASNAPFALSRAIRLHAVRL
ncbi:MAG: hypothetical protein IPG69_09650 [Flavobacteriales bacterium]|nr:hypothetical protein [Flavobacteriales bacterium]